MTTEKINIASPAMHAQHISLYRHLRVLEANAKPRHLGVTMRLALDGYTEEVQNTLQLQLDEILKLKETIGGLERYQGEVLKNAEVYQQAYENQKTLTRNALVESRNMADARYALEDELRQLKQQAGDQPAAQDVIDRLRERINTLEGQLQAKEHRLTEVYGDVRNAEAYSDKLSEQLKQKDVVNRSLGRECDILGTEAAKLKSDLEKLAGINRAMIKNVRIAGDHVRDHSDATGVMYDTLTNAQAQLVEYLTGNTGERETLGRLLGILDNGIIVDAMRFFDASPGDTNCELSAGFAAETASNNT